MEASPERGPGNRLGTVAAVVAIVTGLLGIPATLVQLGVFDALRPSRAVLHPARSTGGPDTSPTPDPTSATPTAGEPTGGPSGDPAPDGCGSLGRLLVTPAEVPAGGEITLTGTCFDPGDSVRINVHLTTVGYVTADAGGAFSTTVTVPESVYGTVSVTALGETTPGIAAAPLRVT